MLKFLSLIMLSSLVLFTGCGSSEKEEKDPEPKEQESERRRSYIVTDYSRKEIPNWIDLPHTGDKQSVRKNYRYFVAESENKNKRLCLRSSQARASATIAREIAQFMKNTYAEATQGGEDEDVTEYMQEQLAQEAQTFIVGAEAKDTYWEKRAYQKERGADSNRSTYVCYALIRMSKKNLSSAVKNSKAKLYTSIKEPEVKQKTKEALKFVEDKFNKLEKPVSVDE